MEGNNNDSYRLNVPFSRTPKVEEMIKKINIGPFNEQIEKLTERK